MEFIPKKNLGQNFLIDKKVLEDITKAAELKSDDIVLEIGAGTGILTEVLAEKVKKVIAVEKDPELAKIIKEKFKNRGNVEIVSSDIRDFIAYFNKFKISNLKFKIIGNIPYYLTGPIIRDFLLEAEVFPKLFILMVQKEVALRIVSKPPKANFLSAAIDFVALSEIIRFVKAASFWPKPEVDSAVIKIVPKIKITPLQARREFFAFLKIAFGQPRKTLVNNLSFGFKIPKDKLLKILTLINIKEKARPGEIDLNQFIQFQKRLIYSERCGSF